MHVSTQKATQTCTEHIMLCSVLHARTGKQASSLLEAKTRQAHIFCYFYYAVRTSADAADAAAATTTMTLLNVS